MRGLAWEVLKREKIEEFCDGYKRFLSEVKTEIETVKWVREEAEKRGFVNLAETDSLGPGDKVYMEFKGRTVALAVIGEKDAKEGFRLIGSHGDTPRLDLKMVPLTEDEKANLALIKTVPYGGVVFYQWANIPLEIRGIVVDKDGNKRWVRIGGEEFVLVIPDLLPHLSKKRFEERKGGEVVKGEELRILAVNTPKEKEEKERFKKKLLELLKEKYGIEEEDLFSADLRVVPALEPRDVGLDRSMIAAYGQDDRICVYTSVKALFEMDETPEQTCVAWIVDREEIGSVTNASARSEFIKHFLAELMQKAGQYRSEADLRKALINTKAISADVDVVVNPMHKDIHDLDNVGKLGGGIIVAKFGHVIYKALTNEANAEFAGWLRRIWNKRNVPWQPGQIVSKIDPSLGKGGTIAIFMAILGMDVIDAGPGILSMHSPYEISSKADVYSAYLAYKAFYEEPSA